MANLCSQVEHMSDFRKLEVWQKAHELMLRVNDVAAEIRGAEFLSLKSQIIRSAMSIPANIVEGRAQSSDKQFSRFVGYAIGSSSELEYHLLAAQDIGVLDERKTEPLIKREHPSPKDAHRATKETDWTHQQNRSGMNRNCW